jgi:dipeptidyl aminopeptidase/acylaminoacyl peptidase
VVFAVVVAWVSTYPAATLSRALTVSDSITMTVVVDPDANSGESSLKISPDQAHFFIVTKKGNLTTGQNDYALLLYSMREVQKGMRGPEMPRGVELAKFSSSSNRPGITRAQWLPDNRTVSFLAENPGELAQIYQADIKTGEISRVTSHPTQILDYALVGADGRSLYMAEAPIDWSDRINHGYEVGHEARSTVSSKGLRQPFIRSAFYIGARKSGAVRTVDIEPYRISSEPFGIWIAPNGKRAVVLRHIGDTSEKWFRTYEPISQNAYLHDSGSQATRSFTSEHSNVFLQYTLVNLEDGSASPIIDAPSGLIFGGSGLGAHWINDDELILDNTFLPLETVSAPESQIRKSSPSIVHVNLKSAEVRRVADVLRASDGTRSPDRRFVAANLLDNCTLVVTWRNVGSLQRTVYQEMASQWREVVLPSPSAKPGAALELTVSQGLNEPPEILARDLRSQKRKIITNLNPQLSNLSLGKAEVFKWTDHTGRAWQGGLIKPVHFASGKRYPLVIQTHGFDPTIFLIDGPNGWASGYAARALANRDIAVLQLKDARVGMGYREELESQIPGYEAAIKKLDAMGLVDPNRVGLHGMSRSGFYVQHALVFSNLKLAAASVSDASSLGFSNYVETLNLDYPGMIEQERMLEAEPWGDEGRAQWMARDPTFHLDRVCTPLRIEANEDGPAWWDVYALLRRHQRPVEYWSFPEGSHDLTKPWERLTSQQGTVDWYDFWLNDHVPTTDGQRAYRLSLLGNDAKDCNSH